MKQQGYDSAEHSRMHMIDLIQIQTGNSLLWFSGCADKEANS